MDIENMDSITAPGEGEEDLLLPEGYGGEELFTETEEGCEEAEKSDRQTCDAPETEMHGQAEQKRQTVLQTQKRDFKGEVDALLAQQPQLRDKLARGEALPKEVVSECVNRGVPLRTAYAEYEVKQARAEADQLRRENEILRQNSAAAAKAPVKGTAAGGDTNTRGKDPFLEGLLSEE